MKKLLYILIALSFAVISCRNNGKPVTEAAGDEKFRQLSEEFLAGYLESRPEYGTYLGLHEYDGRSSDMSGHHSQRSLQGSNHMIRCLTNSTLPH